MDTGTISLLVLAAFCAAGWGLAMVRLRRVKHEIRWQLRTYRLLEEERRVLKLIAEGASLTETLDALTGALERMAPGCLCSILLLDEDRKRLRLGSNGSLPPEYMRLVDGLEIGPDVGSCGSAAYRNETIIVDNIATDHRWAVVKDLPLGFGLEACWSVPIRDSAGAVLGTFAMYHHRPTVPSPTDLRLVEAGAHLAGNAIERMNAERKLRENAERFHLAEQTAQFGIWDLDAESGMITLSEGCAALSGFPPVMARLPEAELTATLHAEDRAAVAALTQKGLREGNQYNCEFRIVQPDGSLRWCRAHGRPQVSGGKSTRMIGALIDITNEKEMLEKLRLSAERMKIAEEAAGFGVWEMDLPGGLMMLSEQASSIHGLPAGVQQLSRYDLRKILHDDDRAQFVSAVDRAIAEGGSYEAEARIPLPGGNVRWFRSRGRVEAAGGRPARLVGAVIDITKEKEMLDELRRSAERLQLAEQAASFGIWETDLATDMISGSANWAALQGLAEGGASLPVEQVRAVVHPDDRGMLEAVPLSQEVNTVEYRIMREPGRVEWRRSVARLQWVNGKPSKLIGATFDITRERQMLDQLRENASHQKLAEKAARFGLWEMDLARGTVKLSAGAAVVSGFGHQACEVSLEELNRKIHPDDLREADARPAFEDGLKVAEMRIFAPDGAIRWCRSYAYQEQVGDRVVRMAGAVIDITKEKEMLDQLGKSAERMRLAERAAGIGIYEIDGASGTMTFSAGWAALCGVPPGINSFTAEQCAAAVHPDDRDFVGRCIARAYAAQEHLEMEFRAILPDGSVRWRRDHAQCVLESGKHPRLIGASLDITREKELFQTLEKAREAAEVAARVKSDFLASMSHEIRTPMNGIIGMTGLLLDSPLTPDQHEYAETVRSSSEALLTIINDILDFSKIEAGKLAIEAYPLDLRLVVEEVVEMLAPQAEGKNLDVVLAYPASLPAHFVGDADRIRQVLINLAGNAVKFSARGYVLVSVECIESGPGSACMKISVADTGIGIAPGKLNILFDKFSQADSSITRRYGGTGLGLAISKQLVELMGGTIHVASVEGQGSNFWFELNLPFHEQAPAEIPPPSVLQGLRVLIVDDIEVNRRVVHEQISSFGMRNGAYATAEEALAAMKEAREHGEPFDLVIADYQMPGIDGVTLAATIKGDPGLGDPVFVMLSSIGDWRELKGMEGASVDACLVKPVRQSRLLRTLVEAWSRKHPLAEGPQEQRSPAAPPALQTQKEATRRSTTPLFAPSAVRVLIVEDNPVNQRVAVRLLERLGARADVAGNGLEALDLLKTLPYDLVLMDCQMPEMDGYEASTRIRQTPGPNQRVKIIALTADAVNGCRERCLNAGMDGFIAKPVKLSGLMEVLEEHLVPQ